MLDIENFFFQPLSNNQYVIEFNYDLKHNNPAMFLTMSIDLTLATGIQQPITWGRVDVVGTALSWSGAVGLSHSIQVKEPGDYVVAPTCGFATNQFGRRFLWVERNGGNAPSSTTRSN